MRSTGREGGCGRRCGFVARDKEVLEGNRRGKNEGVIEGPKRTSMMESSKGTRKCRQSRKLSNIRGSIV